MIFTRISLQNWRNFKSVDVQLQNRVFLVGPNAAGKSNFLDAIRFLNKIVAEGGGLREAVSQRDGVSSIRCLFSREKPDVALTVEIGYEQDNPKWEYQLSFSSNTKHQPIIKKEVVKKDGVTILDRPNEDDKLDGELLTQTHIEQVSANKDFREVAEFLNSVSYQHIVPQLVREPDRSVGKINKNDPFGGDFLERLAKSEKSQPQRFKNKIEKIKKALVVAVPQFQEFRLERDARGVPHLKGLYEHWRPGAGWQDEKQLSDGTLRLFGLMWCILESSGPLLLEEPEISLHPGVVERIPQLISTLAKSQSKKKSTKRQIIVSTHSQEMLNDTGLGNDEVLLFLPTAEGTDVKTAGDDIEVRNLLESGFSMADAVIPRTKPEKASQLHIAFF